MSTKKNFLKIVILGDSGVGKTTLLQQYINQKVPQNAKPTIGADFSKKEIMIDNTVVTLQIWDTAGQEKFQSLGYAFYRGADCCALVYDMTNVKSFENIAKWKEGFLEHAGPHDPNNFPFVLIGNKSDLEDSRTVQTSRAQQWCKSNNDMQFFETSAKDNIQVDDAFVEMAKMGLKREGENQIIMPDTIGGAQNAITLHNSNRDKEKPQAKKKKCCKS